MKKIILWLALVMCALGGGNLMNVAEASAVALKGNAETCPNQDVFFALKPWYDGLTVSINGQCELGAPDGSDAIPAYVWTIVLNILYDISVLVGYIAVVMVAWGGYLYMFSSGEPGRAEKGKKTLIAAIVGLGIAMLASVIMNTVVAILTKTS